MTLRQAVTNEMKELRVETQDWIYKAPSSKSNIHKRSDKLVKEETNFIKASKFF